MLAAFVCFFVVCACTPAFTKAEEERIGNEATADIMPLFVNTQVQQDSFLRLMARPLSQKALATKTYRRLRARMLATVLDTTNTGVGIAAPQVGISRRLIAVQRLDKPLQPFEFYVNPVITYFSPEKKWGSEGCLSVPGKKDTVLRSTTIVVSYNDEHTFSPRCDTVSGFTAVIFQHEIDHLQGVLYIDY